MHFDFTEERPSSTSPFSSGTNRRSKKSPLNGAQKCSCMLDLGLAGAVFFLIKTGLKVLQKVRCSIPRPLSFERRFNVTSHRRVKLLNNNLTDRAVIC